jgi:putative DNA primase/helicase
MSYSDPYKMRTDLGNARRLVRQHGHHMRFAAGKWFVWENGRWCLDDTNQVERYAKEAMLAIWKEVEAEEDDDRRTALARHAAGSQSRFRLEAAVRLARSECEVAMPLTDFDKDPWLLNCLNGTLDLRTGELRPHDPADLITKLAPVHYDPNADAPLWGSFLEEVMHGDEERVRFLQRWGGYCLTGDTGEQKFVIGHGPGANGKSTFVEVLAAAMGDYAAHTPVETLMRSRNGSSASNDLARLRGARLVTASETEAGQYLAEAKVKQLTGGDRITARFLYGEFFEFLPEFKLFISANHRPRIQGTDEAIWRRIVLVPFSVTIPKEQRDPNLKSKLLVELPGILRFFVEGCLAWQMQGLSEPVAVAQATEGYREDEDALAGFIRDCCELAPDGAEEATRLFEVYQSWAAARQKAPVSQTEFGKRLAERGIDTDRRGGGGRIRRLGLRLKGLNSSERSAEESPKDSSITPLLPATVQDPSTLQANIPTLLFRSRMAKA